MTEAVTEPTQIGRAAARISAYTALSRATGFVRIVVVAAVLGTTVLGNTYQLANTVPNIVFELFAAGALSAVLVPSFVANFDGDSAEGQRRFVGAVLTGVLVATGALAIVGMVAAPLVMDVLVRGADASVRARQADLGTFFLLLFLPQLVFYGAGLVASAALHARSRFSAPAAAPIVNNVVVIATYLVFAAMRSGREPSLDLTLAEKLVLGGGTTVAVAAFCALPVGAAWRAGLLVRPRLAHLRRREPRLRSLFTDGRWATATIAATQAVLVVVYVLANARAGAVVAYQIAFTFFLLPYALFAVPIATATFPALARLTQAGDRAGFAALSARALDVAVFWLAPASAALAALAYPLVRLVLYGHASEGGGAALVAPALAAFAPGLIGYGGALILTRAFYAYGDTRAPALVHLVVAASGAIVMVIAADAVDRSGRLVALGLVHSALYVIIAVTLHHRLAGHARPLRLGAIGRCVALAALAAAAMAPVAGLGAGAGRAGAALAVALGGSLGALVYFGGHRVLAGPLRPQTRLALGTEV